MKFKIDKKVSEKYPDIIVKIPIILGFNSKNNDKSNKKILNLMKERERELRKIFNSIEELEEHKYIKPYLDVVKIYGRNPKKDMPTHYALIKRILEGKSIPDINPVVNLYNYVSIKYITPFGGEDLDTVYGDFVLKIAEGDEHWIGISEKVAKSPKKGELIWKDDFDVSTMSLNWRQCERTKITNDSQNGYFVMDGFVENSDNMNETLDYFTSYFQNEFGGDLEIVSLSKEKLEQKIPFVSKSIVGVEIPKIEKKIDIKNKEKGKIKKKIYEYVYQQGSYEDKFQDILHKALASIAINVSKSSIVVVKTINEKFGDLTSTVCMQIAKDIDKNPYEIAKDLLLHIEKTDWIEKIDLVKPGFINIFLKTYAYKNLINEVDDSFSSCDIGEKKKVMVEFGQPNTHKTFTVGHVKSAITGLSVSRLFSNLGYEVIQANYFGDIGLMVAKCLWGFMSKIMTDVRVDKLNDDLTEQILKELNYIYNSKGAVEAAKYINECYQIGANKYKSIEIIEKEQGKLDEVSRELKNEFVKINMGVYSKSNKYLNKLYEVTRKISIEYQDISFARLGVVYDRQYPESENANEGLEIVKKNIGKIFIKDGGAVIFPGEKYGLKRWVFIASTGVPTYSGKDLGLAYKKFEEYPDLFLGIVLTSVEQVDYFKAVIKALELIDNKFEGKYKHIGFGWLLFDNKKASARSVKKGFGYDEAIVEAKATAKSLIDKSKKYSIEEIEEISEKVALGAFKFNILSHEFHKNINYNPETAMSLQGFSGPYVMYSYVRAKAIIEKSGMSNLIIKQIDSKLFNTVLNTSQEQNLLKKIAEFPNIAKIAGKNITPHLICVYLYELADLFNSFYNECGVLNSKDESKKLARLKLVSIYAKVIKRGLFLLGIDTVERM